MGALSRGGTGSELGKISLTALWIGGQRRPDGNLVQRLLKGEQSWFHPISQMIGFLPKQFASQARSLMCLSPKKSQMLGVGGEWGRPDLHPLPY